MGVLEHLRSPQFMTEDGRPTNKNRFIRMMRVTAPGTPRWVGYLTYLAIFGVGLIFQFSPDIGLSVVTPIILMGAGVYGLAEVWRGKPIWSRDRIDYPPPEDEGQPSKPG